MTAGAASAASAGGSPTNYPPTTHSPTTHSPASYRRSDQRSSEPLMTIGEVLSHLRDEFPDTTISKLRFLEAEGLVEPQRTPSGYRKYSWDDVARLRFVLTAQRDRYLPLRVIREQLAEYGAEPPRPTLVARTDRAGSDRAAGDRMPGEPDGGAPVRLSRSELAERAGVSAETLTDLEQHGLLAARSGGWYDADAVVVAVVAAQLARYGVHARHLRGYRAAADREVGLFSQLITPLLRASEPGGRARAAELVRELAGLSQRLHAALVRTGLRDTLG